MISWIPKYFKSLGVELEHVGWYSVLPYFGMSVCSNLGGLKDYVNYIISKGLLATYLKEKRGISLTTIRKVFQAGAFLIPSLFFFVLIFVKDKNAGLACMTLAMCGSALSQSAFWVNFIDISPKYAGNKTSRDD